MNLAHPLTLLFIIATLEIALVIITVTIAISRTKKQSSIAEEKRPIPIKHQTNISAPAEQVQRLESEKEALRYKPLKYKRNLPKMVAYTLLFSGTISLITSIAYSSSILAFVGLGLTFWGALLLFIRPTKYVKANLLNSTALSSLKAIDQVIRDLNFRGKAIYLPPKYLRALKGGTVFIPSKKDLIIPSAEKVAEEQVFLKNPQGICLTPPGLDLVNLYEDELGKDFVKVDLNYLQNNLPKLFIEDLEIAEDLEMNVEGDMIRVKMTGSISTDFCKEAGKLQNICGSFGCPLCSSIACALTRVTGKPIIIQKTELTEDNKTIEVCYQMIEE